MENPTKPTPPPPPQVLDYPIPYSASVPDQLTFDRAPGESWSFPWVHLIYAECDNTQLRFRFPLFYVQVEVLPDPKARMPIAGTAATEGSLKLESILKGEVWFLYTAGRFTPREPARYLAVKSIAVTPLVEDKEEKEKTQ